MDILFRNREDAAYQLADNLKEYKNKNAILLAIPKGGIPIGYIISKELNLPLDIALFRKMGHPLKKEFPVGAVSMNEAIIDPSIDLPVDYVNNEAKRIRDELKVTYEKYRDGAEPLKIKNKIAIVTSDGISKGNLLLSALRILQKQEPAKIIIAVPVISPEASEMLIDEIDKLVTIAKPPIFNFVEDFYEEFKEVTDDEIIAMMR